MKDGLVRLVGVVAAMALPAGPAAAQQPRPAARGVGYVRGVVYDSLLHAPLDSARVFLNGTGLSSMTDDGGRFRLDSVPAGRYLILFEHPDLDSVGFATNARRIEVAPGRITTVDLAVPSLATVHHTLCASLPPAARDSGVVFGAVTDATTGARLKGARVVVSWISAGRGPGGAVQVTRPGFQTATDSLGNYYICGVPTEYVVTVVGVAGPFTTGRTALLLGRRAVGRRDLALSRDSLTLPDSSGARHGAAALAGYVRDERGQPRPSARITVDEAAGEAFTDDRGYFVLTGLPPGSQTAMVRMVGYGAVTLPVRLRDHDTTVVSVQLHEITVLDTMRITASSPQAAHEMEDLQERMRLGLGYFLTGEQVRRRQSMRAVFQGLPSLYIEGPSVYQYQLETLVSGQVCPTTLYVDGIQTTTDAIQSYRPDQLVAVEWYPRGNQAPLKYQPLTNAECSVMLVWTRFMR